MPESLLVLILPELVLTAVACGLFLLGCSTRPLSRRLAAAVALGSLVFIFAYEFWQLSSNAAGHHVFHDASNAIRVAPLGHYIKMLGAGVGCLLVLLAWPTNDDATGNGGINYGTEAGEFFALLLLSLAGLFLIASANDVILFFLAVELASLPVYVMVSISRPSPMAQEAGVKYFFLGAMAAAVMLFGFSFLYGSTGLTRLDLITDQLNAARQAGAISAWPLLAVVLLICGFCFKIAAVPLHFYAGDVYQGAATPVTALLSFVPKTAGFVALIKLLCLLGSPDHVLPPQIVKLLWVLAVLTMFFGNVLGLMQYNVKRVLAYSSIAHSGYMLVGLAALAGAPTTGARVEGLEGVLFYLAAYGVVNTAAFGVLILLPSRAARLAGRPIPTLADSAETFEDLAGQGRGHLVLGLAMAVACFSLIGIPLTVGFLGKVFLVKPALDAKFYWLVVFVMINAAISAAYYLRIVATLFLRPEPVDEAAATAAVADFSGPAIHFRAPLPTMVAIGLSVFATLLLGAVMPATDLLFTQVAAGADLSGSPIQNAASATPGAKSPLAHSVHADARP